MGKGQKKNKKAPSAQRSGRKLSPQAAAFERALDGVEAHERPPGYPGFTAETRREASASQFVTFAQQYWHDWRHTKIRLYGLLLEDRERIIDHERKRLTTAELDPEIVVYQEVTNGLIAAAASEFCQSAEDLATLVHASGSADFFARDIASASAGQMQESVKRWANVGMREAAATLRMPWFEPSPAWTETALGQDYLAALNRAAERLRDISRLYRAWQFHYFRYKHGLLMALRYSEFTDAAKRAEFIARRKGSTAGSPVAYDCGSVGEALDDPTFQQTGLILPDIGPGSTHVRWNAKHLARERNLLRHVFPPFGGEPDIKEFERVAGYVSQAQLVLIRNRGAELRPDAELSYFMPAEDPAATLRIARRQVAEATPPAK
jgi:hypothetical protein